MSYLGSLKALEFDGANDYLQSANPIEGTINYLVAYKNSNGISVNNSQDITTDNVGSIVDNKLLLGKNGSSYFSGMIATAFASLQVMTDSEKEKYAGRLMYLAQTLGVWAGVGANETEKRTCDLEDTNFIGTLSVNDGSYPSSATKATDSDDFRYYNATTNLVYAPLPITLKDDMINSLDVSGSKVVGVTDTRQFELGLDKLMFNTQKIQSGGIAVSLSGSHTAIASAGDVIVMNLVNPSSGRVMGYTRHRILEGETGTTGYYNHKFYIDYEEVDFGTFSNNPDEFVSSQECPIPIDVTGSQFVLTPSDYVIDDLIIDGKEYVKNQYRAFWLADDIVDDLNPKLKISGVQGFSNAIIYSSEAVQEDDELYDLAQANSDIKKIIRYTD